MAKKKVQKKKGKRLSFELSLKGLLGLGVVIFCIFLWMFLLGIWAGQTVLLSDREKGDITSLSRAGSVLKNETRKLGERVSLVKEKVLPQQKAGNKSPEDSIFAIQVASTDSREKAGSLVMDWQARGYDAFHSPPRKDFPYRIFIGRFEEFARAKALADTMESSENIRAYITLLSGMKKSHDS